MSFKLDQDQKFFNWNKFFLWGGGEVTLATFIFLMSEISYKIQDQINLPALNEVGNKQNSTFNNATSIII